MDKQKLESELELIDAELQKFVIVEKQINELKKKKTAIKKELNKLTEKDLSFEQKFIKFLNKKGGVEEDYVPGDHNGLPKFGKLMTAIDSDFHRHETINIKNDNPFCDVWDIATNSNEMTVDFFNGQYYAKVTKELVMEAAEEVMNHNLKSFRYDW